MRRLVLLALTAHVALAQAAFAGAGGGTSGFGGGGGGGGSFSGGGSRGGGGSSCTGDCGFSWFWLIVIGGGCILFFVLPAWTMRRRRRQRARAVELASAEAAGEDEAFAADAVRAGAAALFVEIQNAWDDRDRDRLRELVGSDLMVEWERRLDDFDRKGWHNRVSVVGEPEVEYVGLVNRAADEEDRVTVRIVATTRDYVEDAAGQRIMRNNEADETVSCREYWTLGKRPGGWRLLSIEQDAEGGHHLVSELVTTPWDDEQRLREDAVAERAAADASPAGFSPAELADLDFDGTARAAALDLALADGRFDPDLIEASVRRAIAAWAEAVDGDDAALEAAARPEAVRELLHAGDASGRTRLVVRGPRIEHVRIAALDAAAEPPQFALEIRVRGRRYVEDRDTAAVLSGSKDAETAFTERWTLALDGAGEWPWRIVATSAAAPA